MHEYYLRNKERIDARNRAYYYATKDRHAERYREYSRRYRREHPENLGANRRNSRRRIRERTIAAYGGKCACCGEDRYEFLAIDHVNGGGHQHVKSIGGSDRLCSWLKKNNYPPGFRILCHNCNQAIGYYGHCPHTST